MSSIAAVASSSFGNLNVNLPNAKDAQGFSDGLRPALAQWSTAQYSNSGPQ